MIRTTWPPSSISGSTASSPTIRTAPAASWRRRRCRCRQPSQRTELRQAVLYRLHRGPVRLRGRLVGESFSMRVLVTGANGFIGAQLTAALIAARHQVVAAVRDPAKLSARFPDIETIAADMNRDTTAAVWRERLEGVDAAINCAGVLQGGRGQDMEAIHHLAPAALFDACLHAGVKRVIQISAISADAEAGTDYALSKKRADDHLKGLDLDWVVLRP
ncbi:MAG TPA: NAD-dependent epimerase/dehydratase family protein [Kiloniellaceae bacterium]|nr:NAD-dependent epimerase/dehydratase family protein [Kiloniellaceae bacterium]